MYDVPDIQINQLGVVREDFYPSKEWGCCSVVVFFFKGVPLRGREQVTVDPFPESPQYSVMNGDRIKFDRKVFIAPLISSLCPSATRYRANDLGNCPESTALDLAVRTGLTDTAGLTRAPLLIFLVPDYIGYPKVTDTRK